MERTRSFAVTESSVETKGASLQTQAFGDPSSPPIILIMGMMASMLWWPDRFCEALAARRRYVIRYDQRDTGLSTHYPQGEPRYSFSDLADDVIAILDGYGLETAHVVGMSMGGAVAQEVALRHPRRVRTLTLISTSPLAVEGLPSSTKTYQEHSRSAEATDWSNLESIADFLRSETAMLAGTRHPHDADAANTLIARDMARAPSFASATNHFTLVSEEGLARLQASDIKLPVLAIHGTADPLFPIEHGEAFTQVVRDARLHRVDGGGHEIHERDIDEIAQAIVNHTA
ncbi:alpha/beta hydrolase [Rhizobium sp. P40RR-XXII]|uniref:alpha/beta fold hydrolase n=1 Tax=unclassified Rhizobium TaxID=2613769 RepID=UPI0014579675|nr:MULTISPECIES: alpha/beta hydrolase [unclassified Rhizobium]NLR84413.1 alpha/beta hydrolase [Rhizobium sp. P28RR-XV]NLS14941.1 alpha/beta hydrolase [Rhizobium sp. P40RR-XXII]